MIILTRKIMLNFLIKVVIKKNHVSNLMYFRDEIALLFLFKEVFRSKSVNKMYKTMS